MPTGTKGAQVEIHVHGKNVQITDEIRELVERKVGHAARFFDDQADRADVEFYEEQNPRINGQRVRVEITAPVAGHIVRIESAGPDQHAALDVGVDKFERQLRRLKDRLISRARTTDHKRLNASGPPVDEEAEDQSAGLRIVRVKQFTMKPMSLEEAALQMETLGHSFFFFLNAETDSYAVLYRRNDGDLGLIEAT